MVEDGVIEEARRRQRRRRRGIAFVFAGAGVAIVVLALALGGGGGSSPPGGGSGTSGPFKLTFVRGRPYLNGQAFPLTVSPSLEAGNVGLCVMAQGGGICNGPYPSPGRPLFASQSFSPGDGQVGPRGELYITLTGPDVAAVRVARLGTFRAVKLPGLPPGDRVVVFVRPPGSPGAILPPGAGRRDLAGFNRTQQQRAITVTPLDGAGHVIPSSATAAAFQLPNRYWQDRATPPADGRCALTARPAGLRVQWGQVATRIAPDTTVSGTAFLTCLQAWYTASNTSFQAAVLLNAQAPGRAPAPLWGATTVPGHPGIVEIKATMYHPPALSHEQTRRFAAQLAHQYGRAFAQREAARLAKLAQTQHTTGLALAPPTVARRNGNAWLLVRYGNNLAQRIAFLNTLQITRIRLPHAQNPAR
jgi:hypothetical protein